MAGRDLNRAPLAHTASGVLRGCREGAVDVFRGVPYGVVRRRWAPPEPVPAWPGVRDATVDGPSCPQPRGGLRVELLGDQSGTRPDAEDCLSLTIWTPAADDGRRPVLVWIHGGGFIGGASSWPIYSLAQVAAHGDLVVVSMNYRLGPFGYLHVGEQDAVGGNAWLADQRLAIDWILENVAAFGGDPARVTLGGQSGGGYSTVGLLGLPDPPPIRRAALLSAPLGVRARTADESAAALDTYLRTLGVDSVDALRALPPDRLLADVPALFERFASYGRVSLPFAPAVDEPLLPRDITPRFVERSGDLEVLVGWTAREMGFFLPADPALAQSSRERVVERMRATFGARAEAAFDTYGGRTPADVLLDFTSDELFRMPALALARGVTARGGRAWTYQFDAHSSAFDGWAGACHCLDIPFFFDLLETWQASGGSLAAGLDVARNRPLIDRAHRALVAFARGEAPWGADVEPLALAPAAGPAVPEALTELWGV